MGGGDNSHRIGWPLRCRNGCGTVRRARGVRFSAALDSYGDADIEGLWARLAHRALAVPFNLVATVIFFLAIIHTFLSSRFLAIAHKWEVEHEERKAAQQVPRNSVSVGASLFHFFGEVEVIFGLWAIILGTVVIAFFDWATFTCYVNYRVNFTEPMFVVVIMALSATRPILKISEAFMDRVARLLGGSLKAWWFTVLTLGPLLGSFITEPAAMTITALLLANKFYELKPREAFKYATIGLLFVNVSVGGTLTHFAAPPVLMIASPWDIGTVDMLTHFGWKAISGIVLGNALYFFLFKNQFKALEQQFALRNLKDEIRRKYLPRDVMEADFDAMDDAVNQELQFDQAIETQIDEAADKYRNLLTSKYFDEVAARGVDRELAKKAFDERFEEIKLAKLREFIPMLLPSEKRAPFLDPDWDTREDPVPWWVTAVHVVFMAWTIFNAHDPELFVAAMLFFLGFAVVTSSYQNRIDLKPPLMVGFFLAGLVVHGGLQGWWIEPVLGSLGEVPLMGSATVLTAFNDNAAITYLSTLVPDFSDELKYAVVAGAVAGGGLTVIANAPNPAGQSLLKKHFDNGVSPAKLLLAALAPTVIVWLLFLWLP